MRLSSTSIPESFAKRMSAKDRKELGIKLLDELRVEAEQSLESKLQKLCEQELSRKGIAFLHLSFRAREKKGWPDLVFCVRGMPVAVELKAATGKLTPEQQRMRLQMKANGWHFYVVRSFDVFRDVLECSGLESRARG